MIALSGLRSARTLLFGVVLALAATPVLAKDLTLYSGRGETLVKPLIQAFEQETGIRVNVRYAGTAALAVLLQEEGRASPADVFWAQDAGALGAIAGGFAALPESVLEQVPPIYRDNDGAWIATSGRGRVLVYSPGRVTEADLPATMAALADPAHRGRVGWAPTNGSFQAHVTAMRVTMGEAGARAWLEAMIANDTQAYSNNSALIQAVGDGEIDMATTNNYYLPRVLMSDPNFPAAQTLFEDGDIGNLLLVAGIGMTERSRNKEAAVRFIDFLLSADAQAYIAGEVSEYPVTGAMTGGADEAELERAIEHAPKVDLNDLDDLDGTLRLLRDVGLL